MLIPAGSVAQIVARQDPAAYACTDYIGAGAPPARAEAERMLHWVTGYVAGRLAAAMPAAVPDWPFPALSAHVNSHLLTTCPAHPAKTMPVVADGIADAIISTTDAAARPVAP